MPIPYRNGDGELGLRFEPLATVISVLGEDDFVTEDAPAVVSLPPVTSSIDFHLRGGV